ncbi:MAG TPA: hypothetical protein VGG73_02340 [Vicinamibacterales bacterium]
MTSPAIVRRAWFLAFAGSLFVTYAVFFTGDLVSGDNLAQFYQTTQIADRHRLTFTTADVAAILRASDWGLNTRFGVNRDQVTYTQVHGIGQPLMTLPLFVTLRLARQANGGGQPSDQTLWAINWLFYAVICVALVALACRLAGLPRQWSTLIVLSAAFASPIWMYSTLPFNVVGEVMVTLVAMVLCLWFDAPTNAGRAARPAAAAALAAVLAFSVTIRPFMASALPAFVFWFAISEWRSTDDPRTMRRVVGAFAGVIILCGAIVAGFNTYYFGSPLSSAYHDLAAQMNFGSYWIEGFSGTFFSPLRSPLYYFPLVALLPVCVAVLIWKNDRVGWFAILFLLPQVYLMPKYSLWRGGPDLFARFWYRIVPVALLLLIATVPHLRARRIARESLLVATMILTALGFRAQAFSVMTDERTIYERVAAEVNATGAADRDLDFHQSTLALIAGATPVAALQRSSLGTPRRFLFLRQWPIPTERLWIAILGIFAAACCLWRWASSEALDDASSTIPRRDMK